jgi:hypothetical protein
MIFRVIPAIKEGSHFAALWVTRISRAGPKVCGLAAGAKEIRTHGPTPNASVPRAPYSRRTIPSSRGAYTV